MRYQIPFNPRPPGSDYNHPIHPIGREFVFTTCSGDERKGMFVETLEDSGFYSIVHKAADEPVENDAVYEVYEGDWRDMVAHPPVWL